MKQGLTKLIVGGVLAACVAMPGAAPLVANDAQQAPRARISLRQAVLVAERHLKGRASHAEFERQKDGRWVYDVEVVSGNKTYDVKVDPELGTVIAATEDLVDQDDEQDEDD